MYPLGATGSNASPFSSTSSDSSPEIISPTREIVDRVLIKHFDQQLLARNEETWIHLRPINPSSINSVDLFDSPSGWNLSEKTLNCIGYLPFLGSVVGASRISCYLLMEGKTEGLLRGVVELVPGIGGILCLISDIFQKVVHDYRAQHPNPPHTNPPQDPTVFPIRGTKNPSGCVDKILESPFSWKKDFCKFYGLHIPPVFNARRLSKVVGYLPFVGTVVGIQRISQGVFAYDYFSSMDKPHIYYRRRALRWILRGVLETIPIAGGISCITIDLIATIYCRNTL